MAADVGFFADHRRRNIGVLAALALLSVLLAVAAVHEQASELAPKYTPETYLPGIASRIASADRIHVTSAKGAFDVVKSAKGWVLPSRANYPASFDQVQKTLVGLAAFETIEPKTSRPDWFHYVGLDGPPRGSGVLIEVEDHNGPIASVILGRSEDIGDPSGALGLFARRSNENQSWLVRSVFEPKAGIGDWLDKSVISVDRARIEEVDVTPATGEAYVVKRDKPSDPDFKPMSLPPGRSLSDDAAADGVASALTAFTFDDVQQASRLDFSKATRLVTKTFDGLAVTAEVVQKEADYWATIAATADPAAGDATAEARQINARAQGWAYKLPAYKGQQFMTSLDSLLKPVGAAAKTAQ